MIALKVQNVRLRKSEINLEAKANNGSGLFLKAAGNDQHEFVQLKFIFTLRSLEHAAGALFGSVSNNIQLNLTSLDVTILGEASGTLLGMVSK